MLNAQLLRERLNQIFGAFFYLGVTNLPSLPSSQTHLQDNSDGCKVASGITGRSISP